MYSDYEESFYYNKPSSVSAGVAGEAVGLGLGLGVGLISTILSGLLFLIGRIDILSSSLLGLLFFLLTYSYEWSMSVYIIGILAIFAISMILQHFIKVFRIIYGLFTSVTVSLLGSAFIGCNSEVNLYKAKCFLYFITVPITLLIKNLYLITDGYLIQVSEECSISATIMTT